MTFEQAIEHYLATAADTIREVERQLKGCQTLSPGTRALVLRSPHGGVAGTEWTR